MALEERVRWAKFRVTAVSIVAVLILSTLFYLLTGGTILEPKSTLYLYISDATGLAHGAPVRVDGIDVGKVERVELTGSNAHNRVVRLALQVQTSRLPSITTDSTVEISNDSLIGDKFVDISSGKSPGHILPNGELTLKTGAEVINRWDLAQFEEQLRKMDALLSDIEQGKNQFGQFILGESVYDDLRKRLGELERAAHTATEATSRVGSYVYSDALYQKFRQPILQVDNDLAELQRVPLLRDTAEFEQLRAAIAGMRKSIDTAGSGEWMRSDAAYTGWVRSVKVMIRSVDRFNVDPLLTSQNPYDTLNGAASQAATSVRDFRQNPKKYLRIVF